MSESSQGGWRGDAGNLLCMETCVRKTMRYVADWSSGRVGMRTVGRSVWTSTARHGRLSVWEIGSDQPIWQDIYERCFCCRFHVDFKCVHFDQSLSWLATRNIHPCSLPLHNAPPHNPNGANALLPSASTAPLSTNAGDTEEHGTSILFIGYHAQRLAIIKPTWALMVSSVQSLFIWRDHSFGHHYSEDSIEFQTLSRCGVDVLLIDVVGEGQALLH